MKWSPQQERALREVETWLHDPSSQVYYLAGYAGTGKTTLAQRLVQEVHGLTLFAAFTGKAASVLRRRGAPEAQTLHSILYSVSDRDRTRLTKLQTEYKALEDTEENFERRLELEKEIQHEMKLVRSPWFMLNPESILADAELLVLDECSMVDQKLGKDTLSFGKKVLVLGDPAQLPPVRGGGFFTSRKPDMLLTEIHRQAADNPIIRWSKVIREGGHLPFGEEGSCRKMQKSKVDKAWYASEADAGQLLTGRNDTRRHLNVTVRRALGRRSQYPEEGEKLVILRNDKDIGVLNGVICTATSDAGYIEDEGCLGMNINYEDQPIDGIPVQTSAFDAYIDPKAAEDIAERHLMQMDYGYALTVHKSQGSQWPTVTLCDDGFNKREPTNRRRWLYTAITRAEHNLNIIV